MKQTVLLPEQQRQAAIIPAVSATLAMRRKKFCRPGFIVR
jgi:hypothetical protein